MSLIFKKTFKVRIFKKKPINEIGKMAKVYIESKIGVEPNLIKYNSVDFKSFIELLNVKFIFILMFRTISVNKSNFYKFSLTFRFYSL